MLLNILDEGIWVHRDTQKFKDIFYKIIKESVKEISEEYKLRRELDCDVQWGKRYSEIH